MNCERSGRVVAVSLCSGAGEASSHRSSSTCGVTDAHRTAAGAEPRAVNISKRTMQMFTLFTMLVSEVCGGVKCAALWGKFGLCACNFVRSTAAPGCHSGPSCHCDFVDGEEEHSRR